MNSPWRSGFSPSSIYGFQGAIAESNGAKTCHPSIEETPLWVRRESKHKSFNEACEGLVFESAELALCVKMYNKNGDYMGDVALKSNESHIEFIESARSPT